MLLAATRHARHHRARLPARACSAGNRLMSLSTLSATIGMRLAQLEQRQIKLRRKTYTFPARPQNPGCSTCACRPVAEHGYALETSLKPITVPWAAGMQCRQHQAASGSPRRAARRSARPPPPHQPKRCRQAHPGAACHRRPASARPSLQAWAAERSCRLGKVPAPVKSSARPIRRKYPAVIPKTSSDYVICAEGWPRHSASSASEAR